MVFATKLLSLALALALAPPYLCFKAREPWSGSLALVLALVYLCPILPGNLEVELFRYEKDSRSIPTLDDTNGVVAIGPQSQISVVGGASAVLLADGKEIDLGTHMQYKVTQ